MDFFNELLAFAKDGFTVTNGNNAFTVVAQNSLGQADTNAITFNLPSNVSYTYDAAGNLTGDGLWRYFSIRRTGWRR